MTRMGTEPARLQVVGSPALFRITPAPDVAPATADPRPQGEAEKL